MQVREDHWVIFMGDKRRDKAPNSLLHDPDVYVVLEYDLFGNGRQFSVTKNVYLGLRGKGFTELRRRFPSMKRVYDSDKIYREFYNDAMVAALKRFGRVEFDHVDATAIRLMLT